MPKEPNIRLTMKKYEYTYKLQQQQKDSEIVKFDKYIGTEGQYVFAYDISVKLSVNTFMYLILYESLSFVIGILLLLLRTLQLLHFPDTSM